MDAFLQQVNSEGSLHSEGLFTISAEKAQIKLAQYQLGTFEDLGRYLVAAATAAGVPKLSVETWTEMGFPPAKHTRITFHGWPLTPDDLHRLCFETLRSSTPDSLRYLSMSLSALAHRSSVLISGRTKDGPYGFRVTEGKLEEEPVGEGAPSEDSWVIEVPEDHSSLFLQTFQAMAGWTATILSLDGSRIGGDGGPIGLFLRDSFLLFGAGEIKQIPMWRESSQRKIEEPRYQLSTIIGLNAHSNQRSKLVLSKHGLTFPAPNDWQMLGVGGVIFVSDLTLDASLKGLVEDERYHRVGELFREAVVDLLRTVDSSEIELKGEQALFILRLTKYFGPEHSLSLVVDHAMSSPKHQVPPIEDVGFKLLEECWNSYAEEDREAIIRGYYKALTVHLTRGSLETGVGYLEALIRCREWQGGAASREQALAHFWGVLSGHMLLSQKGLPSGLSQLVKDIIEGTEEGSSYHPSWLALTILGEGGDFEPDDYFDQIDSPWLQLLALLQGNEPQKAIEFLQRHPGFEFESHTTLWLELLWANFRGRIPFSEAIKLRARYSKIMLSRAADPQNLRLRPLFKTVHFGALSLASYQYEKAVDQFLASRWEETGFWLAFFRLLIVGRRYGYRELVQLNTQLTLRFLLKRMLLEPESEPWKEQFLLDPRLLTTDLNPSQLEAEGSFRSRSIAGQLKPLRTMGKK